MKQEQAGPLKVIFNYNNVFFSFFYDDTSGCIHRSREFALNYVYSGEMLLDNGREQIHVGKGECVFIPRDHHITMYKRTAGGERYCGIFLSFTRPFLKEMYRQFESYKAPANTPKLEGVVKLPKTVELASLFASMTPYFDPDVKPQDDFMQLKLQEGLLALLHIDLRFAPTLFDFSQPWKIDILDFMNQNYMYEFTLEELAHYTGRSLATFKRDFKKVSDLTPEKWLIRKRLEVAYALIKKGGKKVADVYAEVGFKNQSHFSTAFKKAYGVSPKAISA
ncbi:AraC family transcriptional regulator [Parabacteroides sp. An277]|uniref:helix-turn-helix domain-containing protein n=1 Tax=Parabacteroides sp. An277 TaxID=1965619 RepID=UPI000B39C366|nr:AraC family transcriptional regulator [Parabacteroides sp. An277]OUO51815.1 AraC family transcriptional regulator [Parabacteroides sp. An277]